MKFKLFGAEVYVSFWTVLLLTLSAVSAGEGQPLMLLCLFGAFLHEAGHLCLIYRYKGKPERISFNMFEVRIEVDSSCTTPKQDVLITVAGVAVNLLVALLCAVSFFVFRIAFLKDFCICNLCLAVLNILPIRSFDGGQLLYMFFASVFSERIATVILNILSILCMFPLLFAGIFILFTSRYNYSLLFVSIYLFTIFISKELR